MMNKTIDIAVKRLLGGFLLCLCTLTSYAQMNDSQVLSFYQREVKAGTSNAQIVTKLMQRGVDISQIRRIRDQYQQQNTGQNGVNNNANKATLLRNNNDISSRQQNNTAPNFSYSNANANRLAEHNDSLVQTGLLAEALTPDGRKVFGRDIFNNKLLSFEPNMNIATPTNYTIGPGDEVVINIFGASQKTETLVVSPEGTVTVPGYGPIAVSGMTVAAANDKIRRTLGTRFSSSQIQTTVGQTRTIIVNVMGEVKVPGTYTISAFASVFHALYMAGGINQLGTLRNIKVYRGGRLVTVVDVYDYILNGRLVGNIRLHDNDVIVVGPYDCLVDVQGAVKRPMTYEMRRNESVSTLLRYAGGFAGDAYKKSVRLLRASGKGKSVFNVNEFEMNNFRVTDGDQVSVDTILNRYENRIKVTGAVFRPGIYQLGKDINSVRTLIQHAEGTTEDAYAEHAVLHRMKADRSLEVIAVDVKGIMEGTIADIPLQNEDVLFIPTQSDRMKARTLTIHGEVLFPGTYPYADNETIEDFIMQAGGLTDAASTARVDVSRRIVNAGATVSGKQIAQTFTLTLKDGFVISGKQGFTLEPFDEVYVRRSPGYQTQRNVQVRGEVNFEGSYTLPQKNTRLSDLVKMAGGITTEAYIRGARLERTINEEERIRMQSVMRLVNSQNDRDSINVHMLDSAKTYYVGIQLDKAIENPGSNFDLVLREGDCLFVPEYNGTVKIAGDVMYPNTVAYEAGKGYRYYINQAGGFGNRAKKSKTFIIYQNGTVSEAGKHKIEPGCEIVVPSKPKPTGNGLAGFLGISTSIASLATLVASIAHIIK